ncbi:MAG: GntR family transcriptional regulator [Planctomycetaceae bacterium]|nr:GntR family transcriptional regulator [Planctomycetaceae bacterium]
MSRPSKKRAAWDDAGGASSARAVERAYEYLRQQAIRYGFRPGERINEVEIAASLGMSRAPVREALNRLVMNGLVAFEAGKGFLCRRLSVKEVTELFEIRSDLELAGVRDAVATASDEDIHVVQAGWAEIVVHQAGLDIETLVDCDEQFHLDLTELGGNAERVKYMRNINERIRFVRRINLEEEGRRATIIGEHSRVLDAIAARDGKKVAELMAHHLYFSAADLRSHVHEGFARIFADDMA